MSKNHTFVDRHKQKYCKSKRRKPRVIYCYDDDLERIQATHLVIKIKQRGEVIGYLKTYKKSGNKYDLQDAERLLAYESLARLFSLSEYVPHSEYCILKTESEELFGTFQKPTEGIEIWTIPSAERSRMITPRFQMSLSKMWLFDILCRELDHSLNNYRPVVNDKGEFFTVSMFDNGSGGTFGRTSSISERTYYGVDALFSNDGHFCVPFQDNDLIEKICSVTFFDIVCSLFPFVGFQRSFFTWIRLLKIRKAIKNDLSRGYLQILEKKQWSDETIDDELSGKYGKTYLFSLVHDWGGDEKSAYKSDTA